MTFAEGTLSPKKLGGVLKRKKGRGNRIKRMNKGLESKLTSSLPSIKGKGESGDDEDEETVDGGEEDWFLDSEDSQIRPFTTDGLRVGKIINSSKKVYVIWKRG